MYRLVAPEYDPLVNRAVISQYERGSRSPALHEIKRYAASANISIDRLLDDNVALCFDSTVEPLPLPPTAAAAAASGSVVASAPASAPPQSDLSTNNQTDEHLQRRRRKVANTEIARYLLVNVFPVCLDIKTQLGVRFDISVNFRKHSAQIIVREPDCVFRWHVLLHPRRNLVYLAFMHIERPKTRAQSRVWSHEEWTFANFDRNPEESIISVFYDNFTARKTAGRKVTQALIDQSWEFYLGNEPYPSVK